MELYKLIATINNGTPTTFTLAWIPENFEGVKISQGFSFVNPIGYTPKFSVDTMRVILTDKTAIDAVFDTYGLESDVEIEIQKLNSSGTGYDYLSTFTIDFESYVKYDEFSEFALKSISTFDYYNNIKNTEQQIELTGSAILPNTQNYINYVSLKSESTESLSTLQAIFKFMKNNDAKIYNLDYALNKDVVLPLKTIVSADIYNFVSETFSGTVNVFISISGSLKFSVSAITEVLVKLVKIDTETGTATTIFNIDTFAAVAGVNEFQLTRQVVDLTNTYNSGDQCFITIESYTGTIDLSNYIQSLFVDLKVLTEAPIIGTVDNIIKHTYISDVLDFIFNDNVVKPTSLNNFALTSSSHLDSLYNFATVKPTEFLSDLCLMFGLMVNFKLNGTVSINYINDEFNSLLNVANAIELTDFKDVSINHNLGLNFASVSTGQEISEYDVYSYLFDWNKILTFNQAARNASDNLDLTLAKYRTDFSGMLDYFVKRSQQKTATSKDNFIFRPDFNVIWNVDDFYLYDAFTPRAILNNWSKFLSFCFQNFSKDTLTISSNGGNVDNLEISGVNQMDDLVLNSTPRLLPIEYNLTGLIENIDFSEKILKINHEGENIFLFVIDAETTDQLNEQTIKGLKIQF